MDHIYILHAWRPFQFFHSLLDGSGILDMLSGPPLRIEARASNICVCIGIYIYVDVYMLMFVYVCTHVYVY